MSGLVANRIGDEVIGGAKPGEAPPIFVEVDGIRVHCVHAGSGRPLVLIHGLVGSTVNWRRNLTVLSRNASVYALDLANMGRSDRVAGLDASLAATADRVAKTMDALGLRSADVAGHSHGGAVAMMLAARHSERVRSLILFAPVNPFCNAGRWLLRLYGSAPGSLLARLAPYLPRPIQRIALGRMYGNPARIAAGTLEGYIAGLRVPGTIPHVLRIVRSWSEEMMALRAVLPQLADTPTLLVWGDRDRAVRLASAARLQRELPSAELVVIPGAGHVAFEELPEEANRAMLAWLERNLTDGFGAEQRQVRPSVGLAAPTSGLRPQRAHQLTALQD